MPARTYEYAGRRVRAMRFVGNGPDVERWAGAQIEAAGWGLKGTLALRVEDAAAEIECGDWVVKDGRWLTVVPQEMFANQYREVRHADQQ